MRGISIRKNKYANKWIPYLWPWSHPAGGGYKNFRAWACSRKFSFLYLIAIWIFLSVLGYAPRRNCDTGEWGAAFQCDWSMWMIEFKTDFWHFMATSFTIPWFHNDLAHVLFVTLFFMLSVQSFEAQYGTRLTIAIYFASYLFIALFNGILFNTLIYFWPDEPLFEKAFSRAWMGGSVGIFALIGGLSFLSGKKWFLYSLILVFELFNHYVIGNNIYISFIHITSASFGYLVCWRWEKQITSRWHLQEQRVITS